jgi:hypothetical protein
VKDVYILEHPTRGVVVALPYHMDDDKYHFSWSASRGDEKVEKFYGIVDARAHRDLCNRQVGGVNGQVEIRTYKDGWKVVT